MKKLLSLALSVLSFTLIPLTSFSQESVPGWGYPNIYYEVTLPDGTIDPGCFESSGDCMDEVVIEP